MILLGNINFLAYIFDSLQAKANLIKTMYVLKTLLL